MASATIQQSVPVILNELGSFADVTTNTGDQTELGGISIPSAGGYIVTATCIFAANATGDRAMWFSANSGEGAYNANSSIYQRATASTTDKQRLQIIGIYHFNAATMLHLVAKQTSGGNMKIQSRYSVVKLY